MSAEPQTAETDASNTETVEVQADAQLTETGAEQVETVTEVPREPVAEQTAEPEAEVSEPEWPDELLERAKSFGISEPKNLGSPDQLLSVLGRVDARLAEIGRQALAAGQPVPASAPPTQQPQVPTGPPVPAVEVPGFKSTLSDERRKALTEELGGDLLNELAAMTDHYGAVYGNQAKDLTVLREEVQSLRQALGIQFLDREFAALGPEWEPFIGKGPSLELPEDGEQLSMRVAIENTAMALQQTEMLMSGGTRRRPMNGALIRRAARAVAGEKGFNPELKKIAKAVQKRAASAMPRPTGTKVPAETERGEAAMVEAARRYRKEHGG